MQSDRENYYFRNGIGAVFFLSAICSNEHGSAIQAQRRSCDTNAFNNNNNNSEKGGKKYIPDGTEYMKMTR